MMQGATGFSLFESDPEDFAAGAISFFRTGMISGFGATLGSLVGLDFSYSGGGAPASFF